MRRYIGVTAAVLFITFGLGGSLFGDASHTADTPRAEEPLSEAEGNGEWTCGMHPSVRMSEPGKCPICNMDLVPVSEHPDQGAGPVTVKLGERARMLAGIATSEIRFLPLYREIRAVGRIDFDERRVSNVTARVPGRIDKLYVDFTGTSVERGEPLVYLYSPSLVSTQDEYLWALETKERIGDSQNKEAISRTESLINAARSRLSLWGISESQIRKLEKSRKSSARMSIVSPVSGTVVNKMAVEGNYVKEGDHLYHIADLENLWVYADVYENELSWIQEGQPVAFTTLAHGDEQFTGEISFIEPVLDQKTRSVRLRIDVPNTGLKLKPGMFADVTIRANPAGDGKYFVCPMHPEIVSNDPGDCELCGMDLVETKEGVVMAVPKSAVLDTGKRKVVYVEKHSGAYEAREVAVGPEGYADIDGQAVAHYPVMKGLMEGERVVTRGNFLIDSQSQLSGPASSMYDASLGGEEPTPPVHQH
jgi:Cu(I)/Ag(I) efflux system membrane fusion protein